MSRNRRDRRRRLQAPRPAPLYRRTVRERLMGLAVLAVLYPLWGLSFIILLYNRNWRSTMDKTAERWEYCPLATVGWDDASVHAMGRQGWEMVSVVRVEEGTANLMIYFKRPLRQRSNLRRPFPQSWKGDSPIETSAGGSAGGPRDYSGEPAVPDERLTAEQIKYMVDRFLTWRLPESFNPDGGISFRRVSKDSVSVPVGVNHHRYEPVGTNLLSAAEATEMVRHMIHSMPRPDRLAPWPSMYDDIADALGLPREKVKIALYKHLVDHQRAAASPAPAPERGQLPDDYLLTLAQRLDMEPPSPGMSDQAAQVIRQLVLQRRNWRIEWPDALGDEV